jgi:hypothetical protein
VIFEGRRFNPVAVVKQGAATPVPLVNQAKDTTRPTNIPENAEVMITDASWDQKGRAGMAWRTLIRGALEADRVQTNLSG